MLKVIQKFATKVCVCFLWMLNLNKVWVIFKNDFKEPSSLTAQHVFSVLYFHVQIKESAVHYNS